MNTTITSAALIAAAAMICHGCGSSRVSGQPEPAGSDMIQADIPVIGNHAVMPKARIYRTNGDYRDNVPVSLDASRTTVVSYPAPTDLASLPAQLADGYLLDNRGIGPNTAFTSYTYAEYSAMSEAPSAARIMAAVIPGARITEIVELPMTASEAAADTAACNELIGRGLPGCTRITGNITGSTAPFQIR
ncbi:MAG: hypothetical protein K2L49_09820 [Muribaculaceae bacterium]|nr:hypothetical protein [Muribaculaceae bacterium]